MHEARTPTAGTDPAAWVVGAALAAVTMVAALIRGHGLADRSLWIDEVFSLWVSRQPMPDLWRTTIELDLHPPVYYGLLHTWLGLAPEGLGVEAAARLPSVLFGVLTVPVVHLIGAHLAGRAAGLVAAGLMALSPLHVYYAQQARMYTQLTLAAALATLCLLHVLDPAPAATSRRTWWWLGLALSTTLTMLSHNTGPLLAAAIALYLVGARRPRTSSGFSGPRGGLTALAAAVGLWSLWLPWFLAQVRRVDAEFWLGPPTWTAVLDHWGSLVVAFLPSGAARTTAMTVALALVAVGGWHTRRRHGVLLLALLVLPPAMELLVSLRRPVFFSQTLVWTAVPFSVLVAAAIATVRPRTVGVLLATGAFAVSWLGLRALDRYPGKEDWRAATGYLAQHARPGQLVLFSAGWTELAFEEYYDRLDAAPVLDRHGLPADLLTGPVLEPKMTEADLPRLSALVADRDVVWLVSSHDWYTDPEGIAAGHLDRTRRPAAARSFPGIRVTAYPSAGASTGGG